MSQDTQNFEQLRRLLALKRYEQPPPGYFNDFASQVIARIKAGESGNEPITLERILWEAPWFQRLWAALEAKPILAGAFGVAVCGLLITGVMYSDRTDVPTTLVPVAAVAPVPVTMANMAAADHPFLAHPAKIEESSTNPIAVMQSGGPLLGDIGSLHAEPASLTFPAGN